VPKRRQYNGKPNDYPRNCSAVRKTYTWTIATGFRFTLELSGESPKGIPLQELLEFAAGLFPPEDLEEIKQAIEEDWGQIDESEW